MKYYINYLFGSPAFISDQFCSDLKVTIESENSAFLSVIVDKLNRQILQNLPSNISDNAKLDFFAFLENFLLLQSHIHKLIALETK